MEASTNNLTPVKKAVISLAENKKDDLTVLIYGLCETCPGVQIYADGETHAAIKDILAAKPGLVKGCELHNLRFEPLGDDIDLAIVSPRAFNPEIDAALLSNPDLLDDDRFNLILTMAVNWSRTLTLVTADRAVYDDLLIKLRGAAGCVGDSTRFYHANESISFLHNTIGRLVHNMGEIINGSLSLKIR